MGALLQRGRGVRECGDGLQWRTVAGTAQGGAKAKKAAWEKRWKTLSLEGNGHQRKGGEGERVGEGEAVLEGETKGEESGDKQNEFGRMQAGVVQWFPGHMYGASQKMHSLLADKGIDLVLEVRDARVLTPLPGARCV